MRLALLVKNKAFLGQFLNTFGILVYYILYSCTQLKERRCFNYASHIKRIPFIVGSSLDVVRIFLPLSLSTYLFRNEYLLNIKKKIFFSRMSTQSSTWAKMPKKPVLWKLCQLWCNILFFFGSFVTQHFGFEQKNFYSNIVLCGLYTRIK